MFTCIRRRNVHMHPKKKCSHLNIAIDNSTIQSRLSNENGCS
jgi:hypothetical protein